MTFKKFDEIKLRDVGVSWSIIVRLDGLKIEANVIGDDISRFNKLLTEGCTYNIHEVRFQIMSKVEYGNIRSHYECYFDHVTKVDPYYGNIQFPLYPKYVMSFSEVGYCRRNTFVARHAISLKSAATHNHIILGTMLRNNHEHRCLEYLDHTILGFNPNHQSTNDLPGLQQPVVNKSMDLRFINKFLEKRWA
ncbi:hypothetical protein PAHAL_6G103400 [Panicum hallii]|uniref:DUF223 domain-containing protein n=1 Tax=Panicum hallii TaxID=206008 RepID=A0A2T8IFV4_9POAL|nr:hypothetical protein PAHAL_6G103400 [Panicum hallii]